MKLVIKHFETIGSTNDFALKLISKGSLSSDVAIIADKQTAGRGRLNGHVWHSPEGNFYCSYILNLRNLQISLTETNMVTSVVMSILQRYLSEITNSDRIVLKYPNDILVSGKKLAGVLTEISYPYAIVGIGVNLINSPLEISTNVKLEFNLLVKPTKLAENFYEYLINELRKCFFR